MAYVLDGGAKEGTMVGIGWFCRFGEDGEGPGRGIGRGVLGVYEAVVIGGLVVFVGAVGEDVDGFRSV